MASKLVRRVGLLGVAAVALGAIAAYIWATTGQPVPIVGVVHRTEVRIAPDASGWLTSVKVREGDTVHKGDVMAALTNPELTAAVEEARANAASAHADRLNVDAGVRAEQVEIAAQRVRVAQSNVVLAQQEYTRASRLSAASFASKQRLDEATTSLQQAQATLDLSQASYEQSKAGPTREERDIAATKEAAAQAAVATLEAQLAKTIMAAPADGVVGVMVSELGEAISPGKPVMTLELQENPWFTFTVREDHLRGLTIGAPVTLLTAKGERVAAHVTELRPLGEFAVWRAARAVGDHDLNSFLLRADADTVSPDLEPGMTIWIE
jgi:HlyD family secretion protein